eukprot:jgi/Tetstr1/427964/TSEL_018038.t1
MEGDQSAAEQGAAAKADEAMAADSTGAAAASTAANIKAAAGCWGGTQRENNRAVWSFFVPHDTSLPPDESQGALASYYGEAAFSAVAADLLKPCGEDWLASQVLDGEGEGQASRIQWEAVESMLEQYEEAAPADEEAGD